MSLELMLIGAQLGGGILSTSSQNKIDAYGNRLDQGQIDLQFQQLQAQATEQSIENTKKLRTTLASNLAFAGMRGQMTGQGSALAAQQSSYSDYLADENVSKMNLSFRKNEARLKSLMGDFRVKTNASERWTKSATSLIDKTSFNQLRDLFGEKKGVSAKSGEAAWVRGS